MRLDRAYGRVMHSTIDAIAGCRHPVVAMIHGICVGGGMEIAGLADFLGKAAGFCKVDFKNHGVFNRVMCGNRKRDDSFLTVTHSFYDCASHEDYFLESEVLEKEYPAFFPVSLIQGLDTELIFYPIYCNLCILSFFFENFHLFFI